MFAHTNVDESASDCGNGKGKGKRPERVCDREIITVVREKKKKEEIKVCEGQNREMCGNSVKTNAHAHTHNAGLPG